LFVTRDILGDLIVKIVLEIVNPEAEALLSCRISFSAFSLIDFAFGIKFEGRVTEFRYFFYNQK
jgi:hypothetical protein